ncbi:MAG: hypothetical protein GXO75_00160 [Calditrichaeota bacterium]|nr:hypothetical protein [Calditrichota bacterium]
MPTIRRLFPAFVFPDNVAKQIDRGVMIAAGRRQDSAKAGRKCPGNSK